MANYTVSSNMNLPVPTVSVDPGPDWATNLNTSLGLIDSHNHTTGQGVQIPPGGLNINSDLTFLSNNATNLRSVRLSSNGSNLSTASDLGCIYRVSSDLWYNDGSANQVRITQAGALAGTPGSISGLSAPASATYVSGSQTFVWQSGTNIPANLDAGSVILRNITASSKGTTLSAATSLANDYTIAFPPTLPSAKATFTVDNSGTGHFYSPWISVFDAVVGSAAQVTGGIATHSTLTTAIAAVSANGMIKVLQGAWTESFTISKTLNIIGSGQNSVFTGTLSIAGTNYCVIQGVNFSGNISLDATSSGNQITGCYIGSSATATDSGSGNYIELIQG